MRHGEHLIKKATLLDDVCLLIAIIMPLSSIPQSYNIWILGKTEGVSLLTWSAFFVLSIPLLVYGIIHKEKVIILMNAVWLCMYAIIISGLLLN